MKPAKPVTNKGAGSRVRRVITKDLEKSDRLMFGVSIGDPYQEKISWSYENGDAVTQKKLNTSIKSCKGIYWWGRCTITLLMPKE